MDKGWICLHRRFLEWEWYDDVHVRIFFIHCLLRANHTTNKWRGYTIKAGQFITSLNHLAKETGLTERQIRTCIKKLKSTNDIDTQTTNRNSMIIIKNWNKWQTERQTKRQTSDTQVTTNNNDNNIDTNSYINISLSHEITEDERELLKKYVKENKLAKSSVTAYVNKIIKNGDHVDILKEIKKKQAKKSEQKNSIEKDYQKVKDEKTACTFALKHWGNGGENPLVQEILKKYNLQEYMTESQLYDYYHEKYNK